MNLVRGGVGFEKGYGGSQVTAGTHLGSGGVSRGKRSMKVFGNPSVCNMGKISIRSRDLKGKRTKLVSGVSFDIVWGGAKGPCGPEKVLCCWGKGGRK